MLYSLNIIVKKKETNDPTIKLTSVTVSGLKVKGTFNESSAADKSGTTNRWEPAFDPFVTLDYKYTNETGYGLNTENNYVLQSLVIPQTVKYQALSTDGKELNTGTPEVYIKISYTINGEIFNAYYNLAAAFGAKTANETIAFNEGWQNTLTITISPDVITFTADAAEWADGTPNGSATIE